MIHQLKEDGHSVSEIARQLNMDRKTVRRYLERGLEPPLYSQRPAVGSCLDAYKFSHWRHTIANQRLHGTTQRIVSEAFEQERSALGLLPAGAFNDVLSMERRITRDGMVSVDGNLYSVPDGTQARQVQVERTATELRILNEQELLAVHELLLGKHQRQVTKGHRTRPQLIPITEATANKELEREGDTIARRELTEYEAVANRLAQGETA